MDLRVEWARKAHDRGWMLTPCNGKIPCLSGWTEAPRPTLDQTLAWARRGNVGLRTGPSSGLLVLDFDIPKLTRMLDLASTPSELALAESNLAACRAFRETMPTTCTVVTGSGGEHLYFDIADHDLGNTVAKLAPGVDTRGRGGQVVFVGSLHPETEQPYQWAPGLSPDDVDLWPIPPEVLQALLPRAAAPEPHRPAVNPEGCTRYGEAALTRICVTIATAPAGTRNSTLNAEAFGAWQLFAGGVEITSASLVENALFAAATSCGLVADEGEASVWATIRSARSGGEGSPRVAPPKPGRRGLRAVPAHQASTHPGAAPEAPGEAEAAAEPERPEVLVPGLHPQPDGEALEVGNDHFANAVLAMLPPGALYRRGGAPGQILGPPGEMRFQEASNERFRLLIDSHLRLLKWIHRKTDAVAWLRFEPTSFDVSRVVMEAAITNESVRSLRHIVSYPVFLKDLTVAKAGWNEADGVYYDCPSELEGVENDLPDLARTRAILDDLVIDFPWRFDGPENRDSASRQNFIGLMLTPLLRPALNGNIPMHMILSTIPRSGKSLLAEQVLGGTYLGKPSPARQLGSSEEEREKRIVSMLLEGVTIVHLDNIRESLDSAHIASLLTSTEFSARRLGVNDTTPLPNNLILVASGNNIRASEEIAKRSVPVWLTPNRDDPENRTDFRHPDLPYYVAEQRRDILSALISMVVRWRDGEKVMGPWPKGGFERWAEIVGGVLMANGLGLWRSNERAWQRAADTTGEDLRALCEAWHAKHTLDRIRTGDVLDMVEELGVFPWVMKSKERSGRLVSLARSVLSRHVDCPVSNWYIRRSGSGSTGLYFLEEM